MSAVLNILDSKRSAQACLPGGSPDRSARWCHVSDFFSLSPEDRREALLTAAERSGRALHLLEKDVWVVRAFQHIFNGPHAQHLVVKGG